MGCETSPYRKDGAVPADPVLSVRGLDVRIGTPSGLVRAVNDIDLSVGQGETLALVGESGCGKTMTALAIMRLLPRTASLQAQELVLEDTDLASLSDRSFSDIRGNRMSMIFQDPMTSLNPVYTIGDQLEEIHVRHRGSSRREARDHAAYMLDRVGITNAGTRLRQYPHELSGGLRQRVMIAMALMCDPVLIIADEPTTALDVTVQAQILHVLADLRAEFNMSMILITHDLGIVARISDRIAVMYAGRIVETGAAGQVFGAPTHPYTRGLIDCIPYPGRADRSKRLGSIPGIVPSLVGDIRGCMFRNRCTLADERCQQTEIEEQVVADGHTYRCVHTADALRADMKW